EIYVARAFSSRNPLVPNVHCKWPHHVNRRSSFGLQTSRLRRFFQKAGTLCIAGVAIVISGPITGRGARIPKSVCVRLGENLWIGPRESNQKVGTIVLKAITLNKMGIRCPKAAAGNGSDAFIAKTDGVHYQSVAFPMADRVADSCVVKKIHVGVFATIEVHGART